MQKLHNGGGAHFGSVGYGWVDVKSRFGKQKKLLKILRLRYS